MSFVDVRGKDYHCLECRGTIRVEYVGGLHEVGVGEAGWIDHLQLTSKYGDFDYLKSEGLCPDCVESLSCGESTRAVSARVAKIHAELDQLVRQLERCVVDAMMAVAGDYLRTLSPETCRSLAPETFADTMGAADADVDPWQFEDGTYKFVARSRFLANEVQQRLAETAVAEKESEYYEKARPLVDALTASYGQLCARASSGDVYLYHPINTQTADSLNPFEKYGPTPRTTEHGKQRLFFVSDWVHPRNPRDITRGFRRDVVADLTTEILVWAITRDVDMPIPVS